MYRKLKPDLIVATAARLRDRIEERFPGSGLGQVAAELVDLAAQARLDCEARPRAYTLLRAASWALAGAILVLLIALVWRPRVGSALSDFSTFVTTLEATLGSAVFIGIGIVFLLTLETRLRRRVILRGIDEIRAMAHIVDMHQLTKAPEVLLGDGPATASSPDRSMTPFELGRYLDYCVEMLSLLGKVGAVRVRDSNDPVVLAAADQIEDLTTGLSRKVWQKIMVMREDDA
jgi:hypothetical protein